jgi:hypothetical protein
MKLTIEPEAALTTINEAEWTEDDMSTVIDLAKAVQNNETVEREIPQEKL